MPFTFFYTNFKRSLGVYRPQLPMTSVCCSPFFFLPSWKTWKKFIPTLGPSMGNWTDLSSHNSSIKLAKLLYGSVCLEWPKNVDVTYLEVTYYQTHQNITLKRLAQMIIGLMKGLAEANNKIRRFSGAVHQYIFEADSNTKTD